MANQSSFSGSTQASPLLSSTRKLYTTDKGSLTNSCEAKKSYGATTKPVRNEVETKIVGHVVESVDTLQGLSIKYGVPVEDIRRINKLWTNDNIQFYKIIKIPLRTESKFVVDESKFLDDSDPECDMVHDNIDTKTEKQTKPESPKASGSSSSDSVASFLDKLDVTIKKNVKESEKLRCQSEKNIIGTLGQASNARQDDLFRPLSMSSSSSQRRSGSGRIVNRVNSDILNAGDHFFEL